MIAVPWRTVAAVALVVAGFGCAWQLQDWRYGRQLADQNRRHAETINQMTDAAAAAQQVEQDKRVVLEQKLATSEQIHYRKLSDAQRDQDRLRDRLATSDLRLSVILASGTTSASDVPKAAGTGGVDHGTIRAELDPSHAQRIIAITNNGDKGLIALQGCQSYVRQLLE